MKILITGASGFIGNALVDNLLSQEDLKLVLPMRSQLPKKWEKPQVSYQKIHDLNENHIEKKWEQLLTNVDVVVHLAALAHVVHQDEEAFYKTNVEGTKKLIEAAQKANIKRFIFLSSVGVHGKSSETILTENSKLAPEDPYAVSKLKGEELLRESSLEWVILRPPLVYGTEHRGNLKKLQKLIRTRIPLPFKSVKNRRSFISIQKLCSLIEICLTHTKASRKTYLAADKSPLSTPELIKKMAKEENITPALIPVPPSLIRFGLATIGKQNMSSQLLDSLEIDSSKVFDELSGSL